MDDVRIVKAGPEDIPRIRSLWEGLNAHHGARSPHFAERFRRLTFADRAADFQAKAASGVFLLFLALAPGQDEPRGYCAICADAAGRGEIDSLFVDRTARGQGLGRRLLEAALSEFSARGVREIRISVAAGNEEAFGFYARFGFAPSATILTGTVPQNGNRA